LDPDGAAAKEAVATEKKYKDIMGTR